MTTEYKALVAEARMFAEARGERRNTAIVSRLADALEAATARTDREPQPGDGPDYHAEHASWLNRNRAVVEAQALEQAAEDMDSSALWVENNFMPGPNGDAHCMVMRAGADWLRARAVEIREGRQ